jgi:hypothetical protein
LTFKKAFSPIRRCRPIKKCQNGPLANSLNKIHEKGPWEGREWEKKGGEQMGPEKCKSFEPGNIPFIDNTHISNFLIT